jgi:hypothetical protein
MINFFVKFFKSFLNLFSIIIFNLNPYLGSILEKMFSNKKIPNYFDLKYNSLNMENILCQDLKPIPKNLFLCYKTKNINSMIIQDLKKNNPGWTINLYDDNECFNFILKNYGDKLAKTFNDISDGPIKADIFRICILEYYGGVYLDIDCKLLKPLDQIITPNLTFGCGSCYKINWVDPAFMFSSKGNPILKNCINLYKNVISQQKYSYWGYSIVFSLAYILKNFINIENKTKTYLLSNYNQNIKLFKHSAKITCKNLYDIFCSGKINFINLHYLYDENDKIILLHNPDYDSHNHCFK